MDAEFTVLWTVDLTRKAHWRLFRNLFELTWFRAVFFPLALSFFIIKLIYDPSDWSTMMIGCALAFLLLVSIFAWLAIARQIRGTARTFGEFEAVYRITEEGIQVRSPYGELRLGWDKFGKLYRASDIWFLVAGYVLYCFFPTDKLTPEVRDFIVNKITEHGGKVRGK